ncbi:MAG: hypothetical protein ACPGVO_02745 [Spirulinaceae cyanobacterium]
MKSPLQPAPLTEILHDRVNIFWLFAQSLRLFARHWRWFLQQTLVVYLPYLLLTRLARGGIEAIFGVVLEGETQSVAEYFASLLFRIIHAPLAIAYLPLSVMPIAYWAERWVGGQLLDYKSALKLSLRRWKLGIYATVRVGFTVWGLGTLAGLALAAVMGFLSSVFREESWEYLTIGIIIVLIAVSYCLFWMMLYSFVPIAIALRNCSGVSALRYSRRQIAQMIPVRLLASYLLVGFCFSFSVEQMMDVGLGAIKFSQPAWAFSLISILAALATGFINHIFTINQVLLFLNTDYLRERSTTPLAIQPDKQT